MLHDCCTLTFAAEFCLLGKAPSQVFSSSSQGILLQHVEMEPGTHCLHTYSFRISWNLHLLCYTVVSQSVLQKGVHVAIGLKFFRFSMLGNRPVFH